MKQEPLELVRRFFAEWERGTYASLRGAYADFLADDCVYENSGVPPCNGREAALAFIDLAQKSRDIQAIRVELLHTATNGNVVFTERWDRHVNSRGEEVYPIKIVGVMQIANDKIAAWRDYFDPGEMMTQLAEGAAMSKSGAGA